MNQIGPIELLGAVLVFCYFGWLVLFFSFVRPRLMQAIGRNLGIRVAEQHTLEAAGAYTAVGKQATSSRKAIIGLLDLAINLLATVGLCGIAGTFVFFLEDRGVLTDLDAQLTGRNMVLVVPEQITISHSEPNAKISISIQNAGRNPERQCQISTADYKAANGYLNGHIGFFDLASGEQRSFDLDLSARNPPASTQPLRFKIECGARVLRIIATTLIIR